MGSTELRAMKHSRATIRESLASVGPMTASELARLLGWPPNYASSYLWKMRNAATPQVHISAWTREDGIGKTYLRAVYALGDMPEARKPRRWGQAERMRRSRARRALPRHIATSVFTWRPQP